ncbi:hypothetical protein D6745_02465 [Candidatus Woesearchaeota archaeon]|nr:MAG: hypothetical protein D6745_02465 [Candidatus Woesearchaeota archaeon]
MMGKAKKILVNARFLILIIFLILAIVAINPQINSEGVAIRNVIKNSSAMLAGIESPKPNIAPTKRERIISINNQPINSVKEFNEIVQSFGINETVQIETNKDIYLLHTKPLVKRIKTNRTINKTVPETIFINDTVNGTEVVINKTINKTVEVPEVIEEVIGVEDIGLKVYDAPKTNLRKGLDLQGGTRVLLQPETKLEQDDMDILLDNMKERINVYGLSDVVVREAGDLSGNQFILVEVAGANEEEVKDLLSKQGKFEAKIGNDTVFKGGNDITYVCRSADCSGIDPRQGCSEIDNNQWACRFFFAISLSPEAAARQADLTRNLEVVTDDNGNDYLSKNIDLYLDDALVDTLRIGAELKGQASTEIQISGSGVGATREEAVFESLKSMKRLQTILITGSLPVKLNIVKADNISPVLGHEFIRNSLILGLVAILSVGIVVFIRYRTLLVSIPMILTSVSEVVLLLGMAALIGWNLDLAAIAGIIIAVGTGVDHVIVITDETLRKEVQFLSLKEKIKRAFFIITGAYLTTVVAMIPLYYAGAGLLKGFAVTTILGVTFGVFIARPAYAAVIEILFKDRE